MLNVSNLSAGFSGSYLFENANFRLLPGDKVGLTGRNGSGKTTLLKILAGEEEYEGVISKDKQLKTGYLRQDINFATGRTVREEAYRAFGEILDLEKRIRALEARLENPGNTDAGSGMDEIAGYDDLLHRYELSGGYTYKGKTEKVLKGLGFKQEDFSRPVEEFSGGWRMRIELAKILLQENDLLLLDEPTNHLDIHSIIWLERFLQKFPGMLLLVSHDRMFLDHVTNRTLEISNGKIYGAPVNYSGYIKVREERIALQISQRKNREKEIKRMQELIDRFRYKATKASFAQSLIKKLEKMEPVEVEQVDAKAMKLRFPEAPPSGKIVFTLKDAGKYYDGVKVFDRVNFIIERGARLAFVGQNGMGKTTLARILAGQLECRGECIRGHGVKIGYFAQNQSDMLNPAHSIYEEMIAASNDANRVRIRDILGAFLFGGDDIYKPVRVLSGGERNRLALAKMMLDTYNVLIMDEPTHHLDMQSKEVLKAALTAFSGTLIVVSHDREFLRGLTGRVYEFANHTVTEHIGGIEAFLEKKNLSGFRELEAFETESDSDSLPANAVPVQQDYKEQKRLKNRIGKLEKRIEELERKIAKMDEMLSDGSYTKFDTAEFFDRYDNLRRELDRSMEEWENMHE